MMMLSRPSQEARNVLVNFIIVEPGIQAGLVVDFTLDLGFVPELPSWISNAIRSDPVPQSLRRGFNPTIHFELPDEPRSLSLDSRSEPAYAPESRQEDYAEPVGSHNGRGPHEASAALRVVNPPSEWRRVPTSVMPATAPNGDRSFVAPLSATSSRAGQGRSGADSL